MAKTVTGREFKGIANVDKGKLLMTNRMRLIAIGLLWGLHGCGGTDKQTTASATTPLNDFTEPALEMKVRITVNGVDTRDGREYVHGTTIVGCVCENANLEREDACALSSASHALAGFGKEGTVEKGRALYIWDTTQGVDGGMDLVCEGRSMGLDTPLRSETRHLWVANYKPALVTGEIHLDTPVEGMRVTAYAFDGGRKGRKVSTSNMDSLDLDRPDSGQNEKSNVAQRPENRFSLLIDSEVQGPLLLEAEPLNAYDGATRFTSVASGSRKSAKQNRLSVLLDNFTPANGTAPVCINAATTLAHHLAVGIYRKRGEGDQGKLAEAIKWAHDLIGYQINPAQPIDVRTAVPANFLDEPEAKKSDSNSLMLGIFHAGLSRLAEEQDTAGANSSIDLLALLNKDALDGTLDGLDNSSYIVPFKLGLSSYTLSPNTLRHDLAMATRRWMRNETTDDFEFSISDIDWHFYGGQYLAQLSERESELFGGAPGQPLDAVGPQLQLEISQSRKGGGWLDIKVKAEDESDVVALEVMFGATDLGDKQYVQKRNGLGTQQAKGRYSLNSLFFPDGETTVSVIARDWFGNQSSTAQTITIDKESYKLTRR